MKNLKLMSSMSLAAALAASLLAGCAGQNTAQTAKPYPLQTCLVCGMKMDEKEKPVVFVYQGQEIKVCDKSEKAEFDKDPDKYMKKLAEAGGQSNK